jgi:sulfur-oxidizing protein SoxY
MRDFTRREILAAGGAIPIALASIPALAQDQAQKIIADFTGGKTPATGRIEFEIPFTADNANSVPVTLRVDSPMTAENYCSEVMIVAEKNPRPRVCSFAFSPGLSVPQLSTRIRLAESQNVTAFAKMNDGSVFMVRKAVTVTTGACSPGG